MKFPSTPHLAVLGGVSVRDDKVLIPAERDRFLAHDVIVEEKIDGANLGISFDSAGVIRAQNRGSLLQEPMSGQWKVLPAWLAVRSDCFFDVLSDRYILFGEWCYAKHSILYDRLPDWFVGFDVFDSQANRFANRAARDAILESLEVPVVPCLARGRFSLDDITNLLGLSHFGDTPAEGIYLRYDDGDWLGQRAKLVRPDFVQAIREHWSRGPLQVNRLG
ncbi:MAG: RNA ligase family protein [Planctomycetales bacterium]|nr:RNA ligase family protein [Planctomycetales bacterium]